MRYNPVELDPEEMCRMASEEPQVNEIKRTQPDKENATKCCDRNFAQDMKYMYINKQL